MQAVCERVHELIRKSYGPGRPARLEAPGKSMLSRENNTKGLWIPMDPPPSVIRELIHTKSETLGKV